MNRNLTKLRTEKPEMYQDIIKKMQQHENWNQICRYSYGEIEQISRFLRDFEMSMTVNELNIFRSRLATHMETALVERLIKSPASAEQVERDCKTAGMRCQRLLDDALVTYEDEKRLESLIEEQQAKLGKSAKTDKAQSWDKLRAIF